jgi:hypothetical protein
VKRAIREQKGNLVAWQATAATGRFNEWLDGAPRACGAALAALWTDQDLDGPQRIAAFDALVPQTVIDRPGGLANLGAFFLGGLDAKKWPNFRRRTLSRAYRAAGFPILGDAAPAGDHYKHALTFFDAMIYDAANRGCELDRLSAQGAMWVIASRGRGPYDFSEREWSALEAFSGVEKAPRKVTDGERRFELPADTDRTTLGNARKEQAKLRNHLLGDATHSRCALCGVMLPKDLLVAAHIVPRRKLGHDERVQFERIAMLACVLGCDGLFELGYLTVDEGGVICIDGSGDAGELTPILEGYAGRRCTAHNGDTAAAFAAHRQANSL